MSKSGETYLERAAKDNKNNYLAAEITADGMIRCVWPDDPLVAQRLYLELDYQFKLAHVEGAAKIRMQAEEIASKANAMVQPADATAIDQLARRRANHGRS